VTFRGGGKCNFPIAFEAQNLSGTAQKVTNQLDPVPATGEMLALQTRTLERPPVFWHNLSDLTM